MTYETENMPAETMPADETFDASLLVADAYEMSDADVEEAEAVDVATASIANYVPEGQYVLCLSLEPPRTREEVAKKNPELTPKEQWDKSDFFLDLSGGKPVKRRAVYSVTVEVLYSVDEDRPVAKKYTERFYVISRNAEGKTGYGKMVDGNVKRFARVCRACWQAAYQLDDEQMQQAIDDGLTDVEMLANLQNVFLLGTLKVQSRTVEGKDSGEARVFENNELDVYKLQPVPAELAEQLGG